MRVLLSMLMIQRAKCVTTGYNFGGRVAARNLDTGEGRVAQSPVHIHSANIPQAFGQTTKKTEMAIGSQQIEGITRCREKVT